MKLVRLLPESEGKLGRTDFQCISTGKKIYLMAGARFPKDWEMKKLIITAVPDKNIYEFDVDDYSIKIKEGKIDYWTACAGPTKEGKIYCIGGYKPYFVYYNGREEVRYEYMDEIIEYDYYQDRVSLMKARVPSYFELAKEGKCLPELCKLELDILKEECFEPLGEKKRGDPVINWGSACEGLWFKTCSYVPSLNKIYCFGGIVGRNEGVGDLIFEYDVSRDELKVLETRFGVSIDDIDIDYTFTSFVYSNRIFLPTFYHYDEDELEKLPSGPSSFDKAATKRFFYFDYEKREAGYLNWRFPRSRRFDSALVYSTNCVISSVKKGKAYCFGGEYDTYSPTDGIFEINLESGEIRVVGHFGDLKVPDEWIRRAPPLSLGGDFRIGRVEGGVRENF